MGTKVVMTGNEAMAEAMRQIEPDVVAAYPITPQTEIVQTFSSFVADGLVKTEFTAVESEHSAMSACVGAAAAGARAMTATSANGLALMWEVCYIAASNRLPIVMPVVSRALSGPINIHCDHSDSMGARDSGWVQLYAENAQEAYDNLIQAVRIAEHPDVLLPVMVMMDGFIVSHSLENLETLGDAQVKRFVGEYRPQNTLLDVDSPVTMGPLDLYDYYFEHKRQQAEAMRKAPKVVLDVAEEFGRLSGRKYGFFEEYRSADAELVMVITGSAAGTAKVVVDELRGRGIKAGMLKLRVFRPLPYVELARALVGKKAVAVLDRADSFSGFGGPMFTEVRCAMYEQPDRPPVIGYIYGLGGREVSLDQMRKVFYDLGAVAETGKARELVSYLGVRE